MAMNDKMSFEALQLPEGVSLFKVRSCAVLHTQAGACALFGRFLCGAAVAKQRAAAV